MLCCFLGIKQKVVNTSDGVSFAGIYRHYTSQGQTQIWYDVKLYNAIYYTPKAEIWIGARAQWLASYEFKSGNFFYNKTLFCENVNE